MEINGRAKKRGKEKKMGKIVSENKGRKRRAKKRESDEKGK